MNDRFSDRARVSIVSSKLLLAVSQSAPGKRELDAFAETGKIFLDKFGPRGLIAFENTVRLKEMLLKGQRLTANDPSEIRDVAGVQ
ncbi:hypothetical protein [Celeribacter sp. PS-C1]|uniref:hypothetical protein n=1 Tax=Celeribacter sp. PS-C1 TaxID=2820813 RepID=UPI001CA5BAC7|nr:hypothetical protein [Celeribacter sp. PS-C1]MBW6419334.1 hypothetical protein [Celeribacter sp. PS-C1]